MRGALIAATAVAVFGNISPVSSAAAGPASPATVTVRLTGLNRDSRVVGIPQATLLKVPDGLQEAYLGSPLSIPPGAYLIAAEVPAYSGKTLVSQTLVIRKITIGRSETIRLDGQNGRKLDVSLAGAQAKSSYLDAGVCMSATPGGQKFSGGAASGGPGVAVYAVPTTLRDVTFGYFNLLISPSGATYYLIGSHRGGIPEHLAYTQRASRLAQLTMALRSGDYGSSEFAWSIQSGTSQTSCGTGQEQNTYSVEPWVNYLTPGRWATSVLAYSQGRNGTMYKSAYFTTSHKYRAGRSYTNTYGGAVAGPGPAFPETSAHDPGSYARLAYSPNLFYAPGTTGGQICCDRSVVTLKLGRHAIKAAKLRTNGTFSAAIRKAGWYTLNATDRRRFEDGGTPPGLLSPRVVVSFRFHASPVPAGNGSQQSLPLTDARYQARGLNSANQAPAGGSTKLIIAVMRPSNQGVASPVYRLKSIKVFASVNGGSSWRALKVHRTGKHWQVRVTDPGTGYVAIRSVVTDVHGDRTEQTVFRAYGIAG